ncbi:hypothetical protein FPV67DRAFT_1496336 [Lyophyllum atratum]|nr:hypothetical protein FPV67DRAFT_1496336 [Lyophyllum atratum]
MKSRIPHAKPSSHRDHPQSSSPTSDPSHVHASLLALGAPPISLEEFTRLYKGPFADVMLFMSDHIKGRRAVARDRHRIQQIRETRAKSHLRPADGATRSPVDRSLASWCAAQRAAEVSRTQLGEKQVALAQLHSKAAELKESLANKHRVALLLRVLEEKEKVRIERFQEMTRVMDALRRTAEERSSFKSHAPSLDLPSLPPLPRISLTQETLTNLHAYRIRLARITQTDHEPSSLLTSRLRSRIAKLTGPDLDTEQVLQKYCAVARARAERALKYRDHRLSASNTVSREELEEKLAVNRTRKKELQRSSDNAVALGFLCEHLINSISVFLEQTSPILRSSIEEETSLAKGYVDVVRLLISARVEGKVMKARFIEDVQRACRIRVPNEPDAILQEVERFLERSHQRSSFLRSVKSLQAPSQSSEEEALIRTYQMGFESVEDRALKLLTRKVDKAVLGDSLVGDVETLLRDVRTIVG